MPNAAQIALAFEELFETTPLLFRRIWCGHGAGTRPPHPPHGHGITDGRYRVMYTVSKRESWQMKELAEQIGVSSPSLSIMVDRLVEEGLLNREVDPEDRRAVRISLTDQARSTIDAVRQHLLAGLETLAGGLTDQEKDELLSALQATINAVRKMTGKSKPKGTEQ